MKFVLKKRRSCSPYLNSSEIWCGEVRERGGGGGGEREIEREKERESKRDADRY